MIQVPESTRTVVAGSGFRLEPESFLFVQAASVRTPERHRMVHRDDLEITVVTTEDALEDLEVRAINPDRWRLFSINCANPFYCVGFIAIVANPLAQAGIDILFISTFTRDLVFVKESEAALAKSILLEAGFFESQSEQQ